MAITYEVKKNTRRTSTSIFFSIKTNPCLAGRKEAKAAIHLLEAVKLCIWRYRRRRLDASGFLGRGIPQEQWVSSPAAPLRDADLIHGDCI